MTIPSPRCCTRTVAPEWLDSLPAGSREALRSRRDLRIIHRFMRTTAWLRKQLGSITPQQRISLAELGAGDGQLLGALAVDLPDLRVCGYDRIARPNHWPENWDWCAGDFTQHRGFNQQTLVALLILHHFEDAQLAALGRLIQAGQTRVLMAVEPARYQRHIHLLNAGRLLGFCRTTLHDGTVSVRAGFRGDELPQLLELDPKTWCWQCESTPLGAYRMLAQRK